jgi:GNAT superfamily N-acetyltransferase
MTRAVRILRLDGLDESRHVAELCEVLIDCVEGGASVSFMHPLSLERAEAFWSAVADGLARKDRALLVAQDDAGSIVGTVQVLWAQPENQPHRADVSKMLVHRSARRQGIGAALMAAAEQAARQAGRTLLVLDTASGDAERLYQRLGWQRCGTIPGYALWPRGGLCSTTVYFKALGGAPQNV